MLFYYYFRSIYHVIQKKHWKFWVCLRCKLWIYRLKSMVQNIFCSLTIHVKEFAIHWLTTIYIKHGLFHQSKLGRNAALQHTHIVLFKPLLNVMQISALSGQLGLGSQLVDMVRDATYVHCGHLLMDLLPPTDDRVRFWSNNGIIPS